MEARGDVVVEVEVVEQQQQEQRVKDAESVREVREEEDEQERTHREQSEQEKKSEHKEDELAAHATTEGDREATAAAATAALLLSATELRQWYAQQLHTQAVLEHQHAQDLERLQLEQQRLRDAHVQQLRELYLHRQQQQQQQQQLLQQQQQQQQQQPPPSAPADGTIVDAQASPPPVDVAIDVPVPDASLPPEQILYLRQWLQQQYLVQLVQQFAQVVLTQKQLNATNSADPAASPVAALSSPSSLSSTPAAASPTEPLASSTSPTTDPTSTVTANSTATVNADASASANASANANANVTPADPPATTASSASAVSALDPSELTQDQLGQLVYLQWLTIASPPAPLTADSLKAQLAAADPALLSSALPGAAGAPYLTDIISVSPLSPSSPAHAAATPASSAPPQSKKSRRAAHKMEAAHAAHAAPLVELEPTHEGDDDVDVAVPPELAMMDGDVPAQVPPRNRLRSRFAAIMACTCLTTLSSTLCCFQP